MATNRTVKYVDRLLTDSSGTRYARLVMEAQGEKLPGSGWGRVALETLVCEMLEEQRVAIARQMKAAFRRLRRGRRNTPSGREYAEAALTIVAPKTPTVRRRGRY